jgi:hypothetical protein
VPPEPEHHHPPHDASRIPYLKVLTASERRSGLEAEFRMADVKLPYVTASGNISKVLNKIQQAQTPPRFTQDYLATKLGMKGGSARPVVAFLKRTGFLGSDGVPTDLYRRYRNPASAGAAAAEALKRGYAPLFEINEYANDLSDRDLRGLIVQATGIEDGSSTLTAIIGSFKALKAVAVFDSDEEKDEGGEAEYEEEDGEGGEEELQLMGGLRLGYTINLHLPPTSDIAVFNAIFKSLRENLLR